MDHRIQSAVLARQFIDDRGPEIHGVFSAESHFETSTSAYQSKEV